MALTEVSAFKDGTIKESDLDITNAGSDGQFLKKAGTQFTWDTVDTSIADDSIAEVKLDIPGLLKFTFSWILSKSILKPAGNPSITPPIIFPWDSPKVVSLNKLPNPLDIYSCKLK